MPTRDQNKAIHMGRRHLALNDAQYRMLLLNVAGIESSTKLDNAGVEDVLATMEDLGFDSHPAGKTYWRDKVKRRGSECGERAVYKIRVLAQQQRYDLAALCLQFSHGRADDVTQLTPGEAWKLIEMLKAAVEREAQTAAVQG